MLQDKTIGMMTNQTGADSKGEPTWFIMKNGSGIQLRAFLLWCMAWRANTWTWERFIMTRSAIFQCILFPGLRDWLLQ
jgi:hypothetical protein